MNIARAGNGEHAGEFELGAGGRGVRVHRGVLARVPARRLLRLRVPPLRGRAHVRAQVPGVLQQREAARARRRAQGVHIPDMQVSARWLFGVSLILDSFLSISPY
jgi:hypothetical protein